MTFRVYYLYFVETPSKLAGWKWNLTVQFLFKFAPNFIYTQNEPEKSPNLKWAPFKYSKWKFSSQIDHSVFYQLCAKLSLYSKWLNETKKTLKWTFWSQTDSGQFVKII